jgi:Tfp pilus assembly protein PilF
MTLICVAVLVALTMAVYIPAMRGGFVWNDEDLTANIVLQENGLYRVWFTTQSINYWPITWTSYWIEHQLWGLNPAGYHVVNILLHAICALLVWRILIRLKVPGAYVAALVFAVHPVNVESVAWITQRKNLLSMLFYLVALLLYLRFDEAGRRRLYWAAVVAFLLAMLGKGAVATMPVVLLLCAWWLHGRISRRDLLRSVPFFAVSAAMSLVEIYFQSIRAIGEDVVRDDTLLERLIGAGWVIGFYIYKAILPLGLCFVYPRWEIDSSQWVAYLPGLALLAVLLLSWRYRRSFGRPVLFALGYYVITLAPVVGFFDIYFMRYSLVADHYQFVSIISVIALIVSAAWAALTRVGRGRKWAVYAVAMPVIVVLAALTWQQSQIYLTRETLWRDTLEKNPNAWLAHTNLGKVLRAQGKIREAIQHYDQALKLKPDHPDAHNNLGNAFLVLGRFDDAIRHYRIALEIRPIFAEAWLNLGNAVAQQGELEEAIGYYGKAVELKPFMPQAHDNLGKVLTWAGQVEKGLQHMQEAARLAPGWPGPLASMAWILATHPDAKIRDGGRAVGLAQRAIAMVPYQEPGLLDTLAAAYAETGQFDLAVSTAESASAAAFGPRAEAIRQRLELYKQNKPYRETPAPRTPTRP